MHKRIACQQLHDEKKTYLIDLGNFKKVEIEDEKGKWHNDSVAMLWHETGMRDTKPSDQPTCWKRQNNWNAISDNSGTAASSLL